MNVWGLSIFYVCCYAVKKEMQFATKQTKNARQNAGKLGSSEDSSAEWGCHCAWPWRLWAVTTVMGAATESSSRGSLGVVAHHSRTVITFMKVCHVVSSLGSQSDLLPHPCHVPGRPALLWWLCESTECHNMQRVRNASDLHCAQSPLLEWLTPPSPSSSLNFPSSTLCCTRSGSHFMYLWTKK